ncbi:Pectinesterase 1 [Camellia lanceoleosa]|uniref:Pectinesterase 1 n=1 Tax=Camellia lanceoleosa TaxID=1840588 RepID=A0ACC0GLH5_9ERIC|nr:Pectinesterase 1 [Camellia lanceoleosa]
MNYGLGAGIALLVTWLGYHVITDPAKASKFTVTHLIQGGEWLDSTGATYTEEIRIREMIRTGAVSRRKRSSEMIGESFDDNDILPSNSHEVQVLAVDDSLVDQKVIE